MGLLSNVGSDTVKEAGKVIDDIQADLDKREAFIKALIEGKVIKITTTIGVEDKPKPDA
jgi:hypothetical protein